MKGLLTLQYSLLLSACAIGDVADFSLNRTACAVFSREPKEGGQALQPVEVAGWRLLVLNASGLTQGSLLLATIVGPC